MSSVLFYCSLLNIILLLIFFTPKNKGFGGFENMWAIPVCTFSGFAALSCYCFYQFLNLRNYITNYLREIRPLNEVLKNIETA